MAGTSILNFGRELLSLCKQHLACRRNVDALRLLRRLLDLPELPPGIAAEANFLLAEIHLNHSDYKSASEKLKQAMSHDPDNADCRILLARCAEQDEEEVQENRDRQALKYLAAACKLSPEDQSKQSAYGLKLTQVGQAKKGIKLLETSYQSASDDPNVVEDFVVGLLEVDRVEDAELVVTQANYRNRDNNRFRPIRQRLEQRLREARLLGRRSAPNGDGAVLPFRNFGGSAPKPRGQKPPKHRELPPPPEEPVITTPVVLRSDMTLAEVLKRTGAPRTSAIYEMLGLVGKNRADYQRSEIAAVLLQRVFLNRLIKQMPPASKKLLKTLVQAGGYLPASVLYQNTGIDAPPSDHALPLLHLGLVYFGKESGRVPKNGPRLFAVIPADLMDRLMTVFKIPTEE